MKKLEMVSAIENKLRCWCGQPFDEYYHCLECRTDEFGDTQRVYQCECSDGRNVTYAQQFARLDPGLQQRIRSDIDRISVFGETGLKTQKLPSWKPDWEWEITPRNMQKVSTLGNDDWTNYVSTVNELRISGRCVIPDRGIYTGEDRMSITPREGVWEVPCFMCDHEFRLKERGLAVMVAENCYVDKSGKLGDRVLTKGRKSLALTILGIGGALQGDPVTTALGFGLSGQPSPEGLKCPQCGALNSWSQLGNACSGSTLHIMGQEVLKGGKVL